MDHKQLKTFEETLKKRKATIARLLREDNIDDAEQVVKATRDWLDDQLHLHVINLKTWKTNRHILIHYLYNLMQNV